MLIASRRFPTQSPSPLISKYCTAFNTVKEISQSSCKNINKWHHYSRLVENINKIHFSDVMVVWVAWTAWWFFSTVKKYNINSDLMYFNWDSRPLSKTQFFFYVAFEKGSYCLLMLMFFISSNTKFLFYCLYSSLVGHDSWILCFKISDSTSHLPLSPVDILINYLN